MCHFVLVFFGPFGIAITSLGEETANLSAFRAFDRFVLVWICRCPLPLGVWVWGRGGGGGGMTGEGHCVCDCGTPWAFLLPLLPKSFNEHDDQVQFDNTLITSLSYADDLILQ